MPAGTTMRVGPGASFKASTDVKIQVLGELIVQGSAEGPVTFDGAGVPRSWHGIVVESGGKLTLENAHISGASYGLYIMPGAEFSVDSSVIDTSFKAAVVQSNGSFTRTRFIASVPETVSLASEVTVDDPNGALTIMDASPTITDCQFDGASSLTDLVRIGGMASPVFDHVYLHDAHCAFHTFGGTNTSATIRHTRMKNFAYAFMAYTTKPIVEDSVFITNSSDFGICLGATEDNAPVLRNNYYTGGEVLLDPAASTSASSTPARPARTTRASEPSALSRTDGSADACLFGSRLLPRHGTGEGDAPLPRGIAVSADGAGVALALPGFGLLLRRAADSPFVYACDAMLGVPPSDTPPALQYFADGSWLIGSSGGLHTFDADGCERAPAHVTLGRSLISALAIQPASQVAFVVAARLRRWHLAQPRPRCTVAAHWRDRSCGQRERAADRSCGSQRVCT